MRRVASLYLPLLPIERLRRVVQTRARPEPPSFVPPIDEDPGACSVPRGGGWRPGARWAQDGTDPAKVPAHRQPPIREMGRRFEAADHPFRAMPSDDGSRDRLPSIETVPLAAQPFVLVATIARKQLISAACPAALSLGLIPGTPVAHARAMVPGLAIADAEPEADAEALRRLALHAARYWTPIAASTADGIWLDLTGTSHLYGGEDRFCRLVLKFLRRIGLSGRIGVADTPGAAHAIARFSGFATAIVPTGRTIQAIGSMPVQALRFDSGALAACKRFGIERVQDLLPVPRGPLTRRLGQDAIKRLDQATGRLAEPIVPVMVEQMPIAERRLLEPISTPEAIAQVMSDLVGDLVEQLRDRGVGGRALRLTFGRIDGTEQHIAFGTAKATRDPKHLVRLLHLRLEKVDPGMGIELARLAALRTDPLGAVALGISLGGDTSDADLSPLVDQLAGRVGNAAIFRASLVESDVPERAVQRISPLDTPQGWPAWRRPARLLRRPEPLTGVMALLPDQPPRRFSWRGNLHDVVGADGPERIHGEWWKRDGEVWAVRDYFHIEDQKGGRYWVFRRGDGMDGDTGDLSWWMHGFG